jgi:pimeloyl-ACP methyl ester carboxylesterase
MEINFLPVDYRGYGRSTGTPTVSAMMKDCHVIFAYVTDWLKENGYTGSLITMGRSLGSASALELAATHGEKISGLIIESGFAYAGPLLRLLGVDPARPGCEEEADFGNVDKIRSFEKPTLIIHAEKDHIISFSDGEALFDACPASDKTFLKIPNANHNDIFSRGLSEYLNAVKRLVSKT